MLTEHELSGLYVVADVYLALGYEWKSLYFSFCASACRGLDSVYLETRNMSDYFLNPVLC